MTATNRARESLQSARDLLDPKGAKARQVAAERQQFQANQRRDDIRWLMSDAHGRRIIYAMLESCGLNGSTLNDHGRPSAVLEGRRSVAIALARECIAAQPELWIIMLREAMQLRGAPAVGEDTETLLPPVAGVPMAGPRPLIAALWSFLPWLALLALAIHALFA